MNNACEIVRPTDAMRIARAFIWATRNLHDMLVCGNEVFVYPTTNMSECRTFSTLSGAAGFIEGLQQGRGQA